MSFGRKRQTVMSAAASESDFSGGCVITAAWSCLPSPSRTPPMHQLMDASIVLTPPTSPARTPMSTRLERDRTPKPHEYRLVLPAADAALLGGAFTFERATPADVRPV